MTDNPDDVPTKPLPQPVDAGAPTEPIAADELPAYTAAPAAPLVQRPAWVVPVVTVLGLALLLVLAVAILPPLLSGRDVPTPGVTPTFTAPTPTLTEEAPQEQAPVEEEPPAEEPVPEPTVEEPVPTQTPVEPEPTATP